MVNEQVTTKRDTQFLKLPDGRTLCYSIYGPEDGIPIIANHGSPGSRIAMEESIYQEYNLKIIIPDRPGYGQSTWNPQSSFKSWADDIERLMDHLSIQTAHISGTSGGGAFAIASAAYTPQRFSSLSLISSVAPPQADGYKKRMDFRNRQGYWLVKYAPFLARIACNSLAKSLLNNPEKAFHQMKKQFSDFDKRILDQAFENGRIEFLTYHFQEAYRNGVEGHLRDILLMGANWDIPFQDIKCPAYLWHGEKDILSPVEGAKALEKWLPSAQLHVFPNAGHLLEEDEVISRKIFEVFR